MSGPRSLASSQGGQSKTKHCLSSQRSVVPFASSYMSVICRMCSIYLQFYEIYEPIHTARRFGSFREYPYVHMQTVLPSSAFICAYLHSRKQLTAPGLAPFVKSHAVIVQQSCSLNVLPQQKLKERWRPCIISKVQTSNV